MENFWNKITSPFKKVGTAVGDLFKPKPAPVPVPQPVPVKKVFEAAKKSVGDYFAPTPNVRVRDFVRELPGATLDTFQDIGQASWRAFMAAGVKIANMDINAEFTPTTQFEKDLFGTDKPIGFTSIGKETRLADPSAKTKWFDPLVGALVVGTEAFPGGSGEKKGVQQAIKKVDEVLPEVKKAAKPIFEGFTDLTTKVLEMLKGKSSVSKQFIEDLSRTADLKQPERTLIQRVVDEFDAHVPVKEFAEKIRSELLPLTRKVQEDQTAPVRAEITKLREGIRTETGKDASRVGSEIAGSSIRGEEHAYPESVVTKIDKLSELEGQLEKMTDEMFGTNPAKYEGITLPKNERGDVQTYRENIYESPVSTSAGYAHFNDAGTKNYFAHTRIEDMADGEARRVIEIQSDLFQKGNLEREAHFFKTPEEARRSVMAGQSFPRGETITYKGKQYIIEGNDPTAHTTTLKRVSKNGNAYGSPISVPKSEVIEAYEKYADKLAEEVASKNSGLNKLQDYKNTWHERVIREEVKQAAIDGKKILQFPTGETAMKIEGLAGGLRDWMNFDGQRMANFTIPEDLATGKEIVDRAGRKWVVTSVQGEGNFRAVPKESVTSFAQDMLGDGEVKTLEEGIKHALDSADDGGVSEAFSLSGKYDTTNPIYKFYDDNIGSYLKKKYGAEKVVDQKGVSWWQVPIKPELGKAPVQAFGGFAGIDTDDEGNVHFDPVRAAIGVAGFTVVKNEGVQKQFQKAFSALKGISKTFAPALDESAVEAEVASTLRLSKRPAVAELEKINNVGEPVLKAGIKKAPDVPRTDQTIAPPPGPPKPPIETPLSAAPPPPENSALGQIDGMLGKPTAKEKLVQWVKNLPKRFTEAFSDRFAPLKRFEEELSSMAGKPIDIESSPYYNARMYAGRMGMVEAHLRDLQKVLSPMVKDRPDFTRFVLAKRAIERGDRALLNPNGVTSATARQAIKELETKLGVEKIAQFSQIEQNIQQWADKIILKPATEAGIISKQMYDAIIAKNSHWMPFHILDNLPTNREIEEIKAGKEIFSVGEQGLIKQMEGTENLIRDPFESIIGKVAEAVSLVKRNKVARRLIDLREVLPKAKELIKPIETDANAPKGWGTISAFVDGKVTKWIVPEEISWAMKQMNEVEAGILGNMLRFSSAAFRKGATTLYIPFTLSNAVRDAQMATIAAKYGFNATDWLRGFGQGLKAAFGFDSKLYDEFLRNGGGFGGYIQQARELSAIKQNLFEPSWWRKTKAVINPYHLITNFAESIELAPRLGVYSKAVKKGASGFEAAFEARNSTIDFAKSGQELRIINMWVPFVNARWQALLNTARVFKERPLVTTAKASALVMIPGVTSYFWNQLNYPDLYDDIPQWAKDTYFIIVVGEERDEKGNRSPKVVQIPKGDIGQIFYNPLEHALDYVRKGEPNNFMGLALEWMSQLSPVPFTRDGELSTTQFLSGALPPALRTPIELASNRSFFMDRPVVPRYLEKVAPTEQYDNSTPPLAVMVGRALGVSPMKLAYGVGGMLGGFGREVIRPDEILDMTVERFYGTQGGAKKNAAWDLKYETEVGYNTARQQAKRALLQGDNKTAMQVIEAWNKKVEKVIPEITPYIAEDDPDEAKGLRSALMFDAQDITRLRQSVNEEMQQVQTEKKKQTGTTVGQMLPGRREVTPEQLFGK